MNKMYEIEKILKTLASIIERGPYLLSNENVYYYLTKYKIEETETNFLVNGLFNDWIKYFKNIPGIQVFVQQNWKYFCQFVNHKQKMPNELINPIKMYISVDSQHIKQTAQLLFEFMAQNKIIHESKIASEIRTDGIVIRVFSKEDCKKIHEFIKNNQYIRSSMNDVLPFCYEKDGIGYALDGNISYNETVAKYIANYINSCKQSNTLANVSYTDFYNYLVNIYNQVFVEKIGIADYLKSYCIGRNYYPREVVLNNYAEVTKLLLSNLRGDTLDAFMTFVDDFNNHEEVKKREASYKNNSRQEITNSDIDLYNEYIDVMYQKYGYEDSYITILEYLKTGNVDRVTMTNNLRQRFSLQLTPKKCNLIMGKLPFKEYFEKRINRLKDDSNQELVISQEDINLFNEYVIVMLKKYGYQKAYAAIFEYLQTGNIERVTRTNNLRLRFYNQMTLDEARQIVGNNLSGYMNNIIGNKLYITKTYIDRAIIDTFQKYNDLNQVITALKNACRGNYNYFTNQNGERDLLNQYVDASSIAMLLKEYSRDSVEVYVSNCLKKYQSNQDVNFSK